MDKCCFMFGHADCPDSILSKIEIAIEKYYSEYGVNAFYVGNRGRFDSLAAAAVKRAKQRHDDIRLLLLLAYHPAERVVDLSDGFDGSYYPLSGNTPRQYAIVRGNKYMIDHSDYLICYVWHIGNTRNLLEYAQRRKGEGARIENLAENY